MHNQEKKYIEEIEAITKNYTQKIAMIDKLETISIKSQNAFEEEKISEDDLKKIFSACKNAPIEDELSRIAALILTQKIEEKLNKC